MDCGAGKFADHSVPAQGMGNSGFPHQHENVVPVHQHKLRTCCMPCMFIAAIASFDKVTGPKLHGAAMFVEIPCRSLHCMQTDANKDAASYGCNSPDNRN